MLQGRQSAGWVVVIATGIFSVGCFSNKNRDVVENAPAPPPSAYPSSPGSYVNGADGATAAESAPGGGSPYGATVAASAPEPFVLREGEQLITHLIVSGDSLSSIAGKYNSSISRIQAANGMKDTRIFAGKTLQVPTSAPPSDLAMNSPSAGYSTPPYGAPIAPGAGAYPAPAAAPVPASSYSSGGIAAPPVPGGALNSGSAPLPVPGNPASTSYTREVTVPAPSPPAGSYPVPSFESSRIQFGQ